MNRKKMLMGGAIGLILGTGVLHADSAKLIEQSVKCGTNLIVTGNKIDRKSICELSVKGIVNGHSLTIKQMENPCFFIDKEYWNEWNGKIINKNTISFTAPKGKINIPVYFTNVSRAELGHKLKFSGRKITNLDDGYEVLQVLGER